jgi:hypothetical protein
MTTTAYRARPQQPRLSGDVDHTRNDKSTNRSMRVAHRWTGARRLRLPCGLSCDYCWPSSAASTPTSSTRRALNIRTHAHAHNCVATLSRINLLAVCTTSRRVATHGTRCPFVHNGAKSVNDAATADGPGRQICGGCGHARPTPPVPAEEEVRARVLSPAPLLTSPPKPRVVEPTASAPPRVTCTSSSGPVPSDDFSVNLLAIGRTAATTAQCDRVVMRRRRRRQQQREHVVNLRRTAPTFNACEAVAVAVSVCCSAERRTSHSR